MSSAYMATIPTLQAPVQEGPDLAGVHLDQPAVRLRRLTDERTELAGLPDHGQHGYGRAA